MMTGVETSIAMALGLGLIEICKALVTLVSKKLSPPKNSENSGLLRLEGKVDKCAEALAEVSAHIARSNETLDRIERRAEQREMVDSLETRFQSLPKSRQ